jgi:hypothetical protein
MVGRPERLVFEGAPILDPPLGQDHESRRPLPVAGDPLDTVAVCPPLTLVEQAKLRTLKSQQAHALAPHMAKARAAFIAAQAKRLVERTGMSAASAARAIARQCDGILHPDVVLPFDDEELAGCTVGDVLADPERFEGATLADPLEGVDYGTCVARIMRRTDGGVWVHSFAHGRSIYHLKRDAAAIRKAVESAAKSDVAKIFVKLALDADIDEQELEELRNLAAKLSGTGKRAIAAMLKTAQRTAAAKHAQQERQHRLAERRDPRPLIDVPPEDAPWLPVMDVLNDVIGKSVALHPQTRDIDGALARADEIAIPDTHAGGRSQ